jgi:ankyrin repeat protein
VDAPLFSKIKLTEWVNKQTDENFTALHFAAYHGNLELCIKLVEQLGADMKMRNIYGASVL